MQNNTFSTLFIGQNLIKLSNIDSTNNFLKNLASKSEPLPEGTVIMADYQTEGRGQRTNVWKSEAGKNLMISLFLKPSFIAIHQQFDLNMIVSIALNTVLYSILPPYLSIKWPNDIFYKEKKLGGILIENSIQANALKTSIIGIGINVNQQDFDEEIKDTAISISQILHQDVSLDLLLREICTEIERYYLLFRSGKIEMLRKQYIEKLFLYNKSSRFEDNLGIFEGIIEGVDEMGLLKIRTNDSLVRVFNFKEITFLK